MQTKIKVIFPSNAKDEATWPHINYDTESRKKEVLRKLSKRLPEIEFDSMIYYKASQAEQDLEKDKEKYDGFFVYMTGLWTGVPEFYVKNAHPVVVADELYTGSGGFLQTHSLIQEENLPAVTVSSSNFDDIVKAVQLIDVMRKIKDTTILTVANEGSQSDWIPDQETLKKSEEIFGINNVRINAEELKDYYNKVDAERAKALKDKWINEAKAIVEPDDEEILKSAKIHYALENAKKNYDAQAVTVDCLDLYYSGELFAYPCLSFFHQSNIEEVGVCEADLNSTLSQLMIKYSLGMPGFVSDPVIDTSADQIIYAHCVCTNRPFGKDKEKNPYIIRSHSEDRSGASIQSLLPVGKELTTIQVSAKSEAFSIHNSRAIANINEARACRTKLAAEGEAKRIMDNFHSETFGWHRVTCYGNHRELFINLAKLYGLDISEEDKSEYKHFKPAHELKISQKAQD